MNARPLFIGSILFVCLLALTVAGCRQAPSESPKYYQRELEQMQREELRAKQVEQPVKDWYPWRGKPPFRPQPGVAQRISMRENEITCEIDYLNEVVRGKKKVKVRFRD
ncbi:MAG: hypothetical protein CVV42_04705 [Candidatus Riflebacteria bacterium HGW-Riflebacteria-2]|jgi:hypothetical protein|nr:MAG: hypothetical protein CVV42_04705 [Candidatus Riflebacteria bacterium HGW-Riflebacteria-2]